MCDDIDDFPTFAEQLTGMEKNKENLLGVLQTLFHWRKPILMVCTATMLGSAVICLFLPNYYKATTVFLAASPDQAQPELLFGRGAFAPQYYGSANDIDRLLTIAESEELISYLIDTFHLYGHYRIDSTRQKAPYKVREKFFDLFEVNKTKRDAIELSVEDRDRELAAQIANAARDRIDQIAQELIKDNQRKVMQSFELNISGKRRQLAAISDSLQQLRRDYGIFNSEAQSESLTDQYAQAEARLIRNRGRLEALRTTGGVPRDSINALQALVRGQEEEVKTLAEKVELLNQGMAPVNIFYKQYLEANQSLGTDLEHYKLLTTAYESVIPATILVERAYVPVVKSRPRRSIIVLAATLIAFLFAVTGVLLINSYRSIDWREVFHAQ